MNSFSSRLLTLEADQHVVADGPLSLQCAQALHEVYGAKPAEVDVPGAGETQEAPEVSLETQAMDAAINQSIWLATQAERDQLAARGDEVALAYGVKEQEAAPSDVVNVSDALTGMSAQQKQRSFIIIDAQETPRPDGVVSAINPFATALEALAKRHGLTKVDSVEAFIQAAKKPGKAGKVGKRKGR